MKPSTIDVRITHRYAAGVIVEFVEPCPGCGHTHIHSMHTDVQPGTIEHRDAQCSDRRAPGYGPPLTEYHIRLVEGGSPKP